MLFLRSILFSALTAVPVIFFSEACTSRQATSSSESTPITKISYSTTGGRSGNSERLDLSADSLVYTRGHRGEEKSIREKMESKDWQQLTAAINLKDFDRIKSDPGHALYDGIDVTISVSTENGNHTLVNGDEDPVNYRKIAPFIHLLDAKLTALRKRVSW